MRKGSSWFYPKYLMKNTIKVTSFSSLQGSLPPDAPRTQASSLRGGVGVCHALGEGVLKHALQLAAGAGRLRLRKAATKATNSAGRSSMGLWPHA
jgi:hypothetical protein